MLKDEPLVYYFGYGSNMNPDVILKRRKANPKEVSPGILNDWKLRFNIMGLPFVEPCFGNVVRSPGATVHGVLFLITMKEFKYIQSTEGGGGESKDGYQPVDVNIKKYDGTVVTAKTLSASASTLLSDKNVTRVFPTQRYMNLLINGAIYYKLDINYIEELKLMPVNHPSKLKFLSMFLAIPAIGFLVLMFLSRKFDIKPPPILYSIIYYYQKFLWTVHDVFVDTRDYMFPPKDKKLRPVIKKNENGV